MASVHRSLGDGSQRRNGAGQRIPPGSVANLLDPFQFGRQIVGPTGHKGVQRRVQGRAASARCRGAQVGDYVTWKRPTDDLELEVVSIEYPEPSQSI